LQARMFWLTSLPRSRAGHQPGNGCPISFLGKTRYILGHGRSFLLSDVRRQRRRLQVRALLLHLPERLQRSPVCWWELLLPRVPRSLRVWGAVI